MAAGELVKPEELRGAATRLPVVLLPAPELTPPEQVRLLLAQFRRHRVPFDAAWDEAMRSVAWPPSRRDTADWRSVLDDPEDGTREGWRAAYEGWPPEPREVAVGILWAMLGPELHATD